MNYEMLKVGDLFAQGKTLYNEGTQFDINDGGMDFVMHFNNPTSKEKETIKN